MERKRADAQCFFNYVVSSLIEMGGSMIPSPSSFKKCGGPGFMLLELLVATTIFLLFSTAMVATISMALQSQREADRRNRLQQNVKALHAAVTTEMKQAIANPDPGGAFPSTGYLSIVPAVAPTGVLLPNANQPANTAVTFTEPNSANYNPSLAGWVDSSPANYMRVRYYIQGTRAFREVITYAANGSVASTQTDPVADIPLGNLSISSTYQSPTLYIVVVSGSEGGKTYSLSTQVYLISE